MEADQRTRTPARGRPSRFTAEQVLEAATGFLEEVGLEKFSMHGLGRRLGAPVMTLYSYYASREALLDAVAESVFRDFTAPDATLAWRDSIQEWMYAVYAQLQRYPVSTMLMKWIHWGGHGSPSWFRIWLPVANVLWREGLRDERLAFAVDWFGTQAWSFILACLKTERVETLAVALGQDFADGIDILIKVQSDYQNIDPRQTVSFGFEVILDGLDKLIGTAAPAADAI